MRTKRVFGLTSLFLAGAALCGCQSSNPQPVRQPPWPTPQTQVRTTTPGQGVAMQNGVGTNGGMVVQQGQGGIPQFGNTPVQQFPTAPRTVGGTPGGPGIYGGMNTSSGLGGQPGASSPGASNFGPPPSQFPGPGISPSFQQSNYAPAGSDLGGMSLRNTQCPGGVCPTGNCPPPPPAPTDTLGRTSSGFGG